MGMALVHLDGECRLDPESGACQGMLVATGLPPAGARVLPPAGQGVELLLEGQTHTGPLEWRSPSGRLDLGFRVRTLPPAIQGIRYLEPAIPLVLGEPDGVMDLSMRFQAPPGWTLVGPQSPFAPATTLALALGQGLPRLHADVAAGRPVRLEVVVRPGEEERAPRLLAAGREALGFLARTLGVFPYPQMSLVSGDPSRQGGTPLGPSLAALHGRLPPDEDPQDWWRWLVAHELAHQYFGQAIPEADKPGWVWLGLGLYADWLFTQHTGLHCQAHRRLVQSWVDREGLDLPTRLGGGPGREPPHPSVSFRQAVLHGKAFAFFLALEARIGRPDLAARMRRLVRESPGRPLGRSRLEELCGAPDLFEAWVDLEIPHRRLPGAGLALALTLARPSSG